MRLLAIETSGLAGSVAAYEAARLLRHIHLDPRLRSARTLAPELHTLLAELDWQRTPVDLVAVSAGPGSFTGLRVGVVTAKLLAYAWKCALLGVDTLQALARQLEDQIADDRLAVVLDAGRGQVYAARFRRNSHGAFEADAPTSLLDVESWLASLCAGTAVAGPVLVQLATSLPDGIHIVPRELWLPDARGVALAALERWHRGERDDPFTLVPRYLRPSAAEEKWKARGP
jgi:tRNA threonylcarbamoyladenosine biosynthesis protein TsaB